MKAVAVLLLALVCVQAAAGRELLGKHKKYEEAKYEPVYKVEYTHPVYEPKKAEPVHKVAYEPKKVEPVVVAPKPAPKPIVITCKPKLVVSTVAANASCGTGYTSTADAYGKGITCVKKVCVDPKPVYVPEPKKVEYVAYPVSYHKGSKKDKYSKYEEPKYEKKAEPVYAPKKVEYAPKKEEPKKVEVVKAEPICHDEYAHPIYTCGAGYTLSGTHCVISAPGPCPKGYTASAGKCTKTVVVEVEEEKKPKYEPVYTAAVSYGWGHKKSKHAKYEQEYKHEEEYKHKEEEYKHEEEEYKHEDEYCEEEEHKEEYKHEEEHKYEVEYKKEEPKKAKYEPAYVHFGKGKKSKYGKHGL